MQTNHIPAQSNNPPSEKKTVKIDLKMYAALALGIFLFTFINNVLPGGNPLSWGILSAFSILFAFILFQENIKNVLWVFIGGVTAIIIYIVLNLFSIFFNIFILTAVANVSAPVIAGFIAAILSKEQRIVNGVGAGIVWSFYPAFDTFFSTDPIIKENLASVIATLVLLGGILGAMGGFFSSKLRR